MKKELLELLLTKHNSTVKDEYVCGLDKFEDWLLTDGNFEENYIEIPSYQMKSGTAAWLDW